MILVDNYFLAILCCVICCACWGSWANTQKMVAAKQWSFELFYWDLTVGLFLTALLGAVTLGSMGSEGRTFFQDLAVMDWSSIQYAFLGGVVWNFGNIFLTAAIAVAGMSVGFPIGGGLAWIGGIVFNYLLISLAGQTYQGNQLLLWSGVLVIIVAIIWFCLWWRKKSYGVSVAKMKNCEERLRKWFIKSAIQRNGNQIFH